MAHDLIFGSRPRRFSRDLSDDDVCGSDLVEEVKAGTSSLRLVYQTVPKPVKIAMVVGGVLIACGAFSWLAKNVNARV